MLLNHHLLTLQMGVHSSHQQHSRTHREAASKLAMADDDEDEVHHEASDESDDDDDADLATAYKWAIVLAATLLDSPQDLRLWSGRRLEQGVNLRLLEQQITFEDVPDLVEEIVSRDRRRGASTIGWRLSTKSSTPRFSNSAAKICWMLSANAQLEILNAAKPPFSTPRSARQSRPDRERRRKGRFGARSD